MLKKSVYFLVMLALCLSMATMAQAAEFKGGESTNITADQKIEGNLYASGAMLNMDGEVTGDLFAVGGTVIINGKIAKDLNAAGGNVFINGEVNEDMRVGGGNISINTPVKGELMVGGGQIILGANTVVEGNAYVGGGMATINGEIKGDLYTSTDTLFINGKVAGNVYTQTTNITLGDQAEINGALLYKSYEEIEIPASALIKGGAHFEKMERPAPQPKTKPVEPKDVFGPLIALFWTFKTVNTLVLGLVLFLIFKKYFTQMIANNLEKFWYKVLLGLIIVIVVPIASILLMFTALGFSVAMAIITLSVLVSIIAKALAGAALGTWLFSLNKKSAKNKTKELKITWYTVVLGIFLMSLVTLIPFVGWIFVLIFFLGAVGTLFHTRWLEVKS